MTIDLNEKIICQSCGMPMKVEEDFGMELTGERNKEYCKFCYTDGEFTSPNITLNEMINKLVRASIDTLGLDEDLARKMAETKLPQLKRWKSE